MCACNISSKEREAGPMTANGDKEEDGDYPLNSRSRRESVTSRTRNFHAGLAHVLLARSNCVPIMGAIVHPRIKQGSLLCGARSQGRQGDRVTMQEIVAVRLPTEVCIIMFIGTNRGTYLDTAALVTCLSNFSSNRATVIGLLKAFKGLCGAIFNQFYAAFLAPDQTSFILLTALGPTVVIMPLILMMGPGSTLKVPMADDSEDLNFRLLYGASMVLAAYMLNVTLVQDLRSVNNTTNIAFTVVLFLVLLLPLFVPKIAELSIKRHGKEIRKLRSPLLGEKRAMDGENGQVSNVYTEEQKLLGNAREHLLLGSDQTLSKALTSGNFWLLFFSVFFSMGSGTTAFNNLGQMAETQGYENTEVFVSLSNIWNFMGRLVGGYMSEVSTRDYAHPRALGLAVAQVVMATGHLLFALAPPKTIYVAVFLVAAGYGAEWAVFPTALSELYGLQNFGVLYNLLTMASPAGSLIYSTFIAGPMYDREARKQGSSTCEGTICFETTFFIMAAVCVTAAALSIALAIRTRSFYRRC
ncbi:hypothetical protein L7F22_041680 [Adiantum nelumboides]|nr:hypothetical protein [Adiantum nelumboides]